MANTSSIVARIRRELGDMGETFQSSILGDGSTTSFNLPEGSVDPTSLTVYIQTSAGGVITIPPTGYTLSADDILVLQTPVPSGSTLVVQGTSYAIFSDAELTQYVHDAVLQHTTGRTVDVRYRDVNGFIQYTHVDMNVSTLPEVEEYPVALLATIFALWSLATDASTDIDVSSAEGTHLPRSQRFAQIRSQIEALQERYDTVARQLNVGISRVEMSTLRRVSRLNNRLVPVYVDREFDDHTYPIRILPQIDRRGVDESGVSSPAYDWGPW